MRQRIGADVPIRFSISLDLDLMYTAWCGRVSIEEFRAIFVRYVEDPNYRPGRTELIDFSDVEHIDANFSSIWSALNLVNAQVPGQVVRTRTVMVAPGDVVFGLARMFQTLAENADGIKVEVYRSATMALDALDLDFASVEELLERGGFFPFVPDVPSAADGG